MLYDNVDRYKPIFSWPFPSLLRSIYITIAWHMPEQLRAFPNKWTGNFKTQLKQAAINIFPDQQINQKF